MILSGEIIEHEGSADHPEALGGFGHQFRQAGLPHLSIGIENKYSLQPG